MTPQEKQEYIKKVYGQAIGAGLVRTMKEFAGALEIDVSGLSSAINGKERYLTDRLVRKVERYAAANGLDGNPLPAQQQRQIPGEVGGVFVPEPLRAMFENMTETIRLQAQMLASGPFTPGASMYGQKNFRTDGK